MPGEVQINAERLWSRMEVLSRITDPDLPWTRRSFSPLFLEGRAWLRAQFVEAGLSTRIDAGGNLIGRREGTRADGPAILVGSHSDTVPAGGRFDGILGVIAGLELAQSLREQGVALHHPLEIIDFLAEEPSEFGLSCIGSRAFSGALTPEMLSMTRPDGTSLRHALREVGGDPDALPLARRPDGTIRAYLELHIEQGRVLEAEGVEIGVVTDIAGIRRDRLIVFGRSDHAGATPMNLRQDALVGASGIVQAVWHKARTWPDPAQSLVATVGQIAVTPNAANAVPGTAVLMLEVRSADARAPARFVQDIVAEAAGALADLGLTLATEHVSEVAPTPCDPVLQTAIERASVGLGLTSRRLPSGAGHDGVFVSRLSPMAMIFVPCREGRSHAPNEWLEPGQAADGARVLARAVCLVDEEG